MSINHARQLFVAEHNSAGGDLDVDVQSFRHSRAIFVTDVAFVGQNPSDTDGDTTAIDVSYSTDGFSSSDVEVAALAAQEFNDTDNDIGTLRTPVTVPLTSATSFNGVTGVQVPAGAVVEVTTTNVGAGVDTRHSVIVEYIVL